jgi:hypothetical protein
MNQYVNKKSSKLTLDWCIEKYGPSAYANVKTLTINLNPNLECLGQYFPYPNIIVINPKKHRSLIALCSTIIHEYTHFQQDMVKYLEYRTSYDNHPYEISSNNRSDRDKLEARKYVLGKLRKRL